MAGVYDIGNAQKAPKGLAAGTVVKTNGGNYRIDSVNADGSYKSSQVPSESSSVSTKFTPKQAQLRGLELGDMYGLTYDADAIQRKFDAGTKAQYDVLKKEYAVTENQFYNKMFDTQATALDTIRRQNSQAVATGASRGMQAANELSSILGLEQTMVPEASKLAQDRNMLVDKEGAAYAKNAVDALSESNRIRQQIMTGAAGIYSADTQLNVGEMEYYAALNQAAKNLEGMLAQSNAQRYNADQNLVGTKFTAQKNFDGTVYNANTNAGATRYAADQNRRGQEALAGAQTNAAKIQAASYGQQNSGPSIGAMLANAVATNNPAEFHGILSQTGMSSKEEREALWGQMVLGQAGLGPRNPSLASLPMAYGSSAPSGSILPGLYGPRGVQTAPEFWNLINSR